MRALKIMWQLIKGSALEFGRDRAMAFAAAIAFYTALSFAPLVLLIMTIGTFLGESASNELVRFFELQIGEQAGDVTEQIVEHGGSGQKSQAEWRVVIGVALLLFAASGVFAQLQAALNHVWEVEPRPGAGLWGWVRKRLLSMGMVLAILFILLVALVVSAVIERFVPSDSGVLARTASLVISLAVFTALFAAIYRILPDAEIRWADVWLGAGVTAGMFALGKLGISLYLEHARVARSYGDAAGSLIALLLWVYFSAIIFFFGAEITQQYGRLRGRGVLPSKHAQRVIETRARVDERR